MFDLVIFVHGYFFSSKRMNISVLQIKTFRLIILLLIVIIAVVLRICIQTHHASNALRRNTLSRAIKTELISHLPWRWRSIWRKRMILPLGHVAGAQAIS